MWGTRIVPELCRKIDGPGKIVFQLGEEAFNQPFKTGPLIDQDGNFALFDILMNKPMFDFIADRGLYSRKGQRQFGDKIDFPIGKQSGQANTAPGQMGAIMLKVSYRILDPVKNKDLLDKFHTADALIYFPGPPAHQDRPGMRRKEARPDRLPRRSQDELRSAMGMDVIRACQQRPGCRGCWSQQSVAAIQFLQGRLQRLRTANDTPPQPWDPDVSLKVPDLFQEPGGEGEDGSDSGPRRGG